MPLADLDTAALRSLRTAARDGVRLWFLAGGKRGLTREEVLDVAGLSNDEHRMRCSIRDTVRSKARGLAVPTLDARVREALDEPDGEKGDARTPCPAEGCPGLEWHDGEPNGCGHPTMTSEENACPWAP